MAHLQIPAVQGLYGQGFGAHPMASVGHVARRGYGDTLFEGVKPANAPEFTLEESTRLFENPDVGLTVFEQLGLQVKDSMRRYLLLVLFFEPCATGRFHALGIVIMFVQHGPHVLLQSGRVKKCGKNPLASSCNPKVCGKRGQGHGEKVQTVNEFDAPGNRDVQKFGPVDNLRRDHRLLVQFLQQQVAIVPLEMVSDQHERAVSGVRHSQLQDLGHEFLHRRKLVTLVVQTGLGAHQIHAMSLTRFLHTLAIEKDFHDGVLLGKVQGPLVGGGAAGRLGVF